jgi:tRNA(fMet)-specific endonuclease VapC
MERMQATAADDLHIPTIVIAEIQYGIRKSGNPDGFRDRWNRFLLPFPRLPFDEFAADAHARLRWELRHQPIGERDLFIAAIAVARNATVITNNRREFARVPGLTVEDWTT